MDARMTATPAWPPASTPRLYIASPLTDGATAEIDGNAAHYLRNVMRIAVGDPLRLFDDIGGEWLARCTAVGKRSVAVQLTDKLREREAVADLWLCFAPVKKAPLDWLVEKATELGAARLVPVITERTIVERVNLDRLRSITIEAAEQCGRTALPQLAEPVKLPALLASWPIERALLFADESGGLPAHAAMTSAPPPAALLTGPEGGFTPREQALLLAHPATRRISLGPRILRAETAALAGIALWTAIHDANSPGRESGS
jgi:16S rRNA (uracil1498-N3)-methyltransferase